MKNHFKEGLYPQKGNGAIWLGFLDIVCERWASFYFPKPRDEAWALKALSQINTPTHTHTMVMTSDWRCSRYMWAPPAGPGVLIKVTVLAEFVGTS